MPLGVEHEFEFIEIHVNKEVSQPLMPLGVEHQVQKL